MKAFQLDSRLAADTMPVAQLKSGPLLLMNDARWPWLILVPAVPDAIELYDLEAATAADVHADTLRTARALTQVTGCDKINSGALGNIVRQLHVHVIARFDGDPNWPGPVWGYGTRQPYQPDKSAALVARIVAALGEGAG